MLFSQVLYSPLTQVITERSTEKPARPQPCDCVPLEDKHAPLPCFAHKSDLKAATAAMRGSEARCSAVLSGLPEWLVQGAVVPSQKKFLSLILRVFFFFKLHIQSASLVIVLWFCSKSCFLMRLKSSRRSFFCRGRVIRCSDQGKGLAEDWEHWAGLPFLLTACDSCNYSPLFLGG